MIKNVSFKGQVYLVGAMLKHSDSKEVKEMRKYANDNDCDVVVLNKKKNSNGTEAFDVLVAKQNKDGNSNEINSKTFDLFSKVSPSETKKVDTEEDSSKRLPHETLDQYMLRTDSDFAMLYENSHLA